MLDAAVADPLRRDLEVRRICQAVTPVEAVILHYSHNAPASSRDIAATTGFARDARDVHREPGFVQ
jgi:hypothetical protein